MPRHPARHFGEVDLGVADALADQRFSTGRAHARHALLVDLVVEEGAVIHERISSGIL
jgi:hypothetical protein